MKLIHVTLIALTLSITFQSTVKAAVKVAPTQTVTLKTTDTGYWTYMKLKQGYNYANLYKTPYKGSEVLNTLQNNSKIFVTGKKMNGLVQVVFNDEYGWLIQR